MRGRLECDVHDGLVQFPRSCDLVWGRLWGGGNAPIRSTPVCLLPREDLDAWLALARPAGEGVEEPLSSYASILLEILGTRGASFTQELQRASDLLPSHVEMGLSQLIGHGVVTCNSFVG